LKELRGVFVIGDEHAQGQAGTRPWSDLLHGGHPRPVEIDEDSPVYLCYTSGTTGLPKGVICTHFNLIHTLLTYELVKGLSAETSLCSAFPSFILPGWRPSFSTRAARLSCSACLSGPALELIERERVTHFFGVPTMYIMLMNHSDFRQRDSSSLRLAASGGAPVPSDVVRSWTQQAPQVRFFNFYGLTETTSPATCLPDRYKLERPGSVGLPLPVSELLVVGDHHEPVPPGEVGELAIRGPMVFKEYWRNPEATQAAFLDGGWFLKVTWPALTRMVSCTLWIAKRI
jgi:long-chain acyl-CoA synthetase